jgi:hypothetical protein
MKRGFHFNFLFILIGIGKHVYPQVRLYAELEYIIGFIFLLVILLVSIVGPIVSHRVRGRLCTSNFNVIFLGYAMICWLVIKFSLL